MFQCVPPAPTCGVVDTPHLGSSRGAGPVVLVGRAHHLSAGGEVTARGGEVTVIMRQIAVPVEGLAGCGLGDRHPCQVTATVEAWLLKVGILHTSGGG